MNQPSTSRFDPRDWKPIESAPKDGTPVLLACAGYKSMTVGFWADPVEYEGEAEGWTLEMNDPAIDPFSAAYWGGCSECSDPTHWMPLPPPPGSET